MSQLPSDSLATARPAPDPPGRRRAWLAYVTMLFATFALLAVVIHVMAGVGQFAAALLGSDWRWVALAVALVVVNINLAAWRFSIAISCLDVRIGHPRALDAVLASWPLALVTPSRAGDSVRAVAIRDLLPIPEGISAVLAEKLVDVQSLCVLSAAGAALTGAWPVFWLASSALVAGWLAVVALVVFAEMLPRVPLLRLLGDKPRRMVSGIRALGTRPGRFALLSAISLLAFAESCVICWALLRAVGADVPFASVAAVWPAAVFAGMMPVTLVGLGTRDATFLGLLHATGVNAPEGEVLAATVMFAIVGTALPALLGVPFMVRHTRRLTARVATARSSAR